MSTAREVMQTNNKFTSIDGLVHYSRTRLPDNLILVYTFTDKSKVHYDIKHNTWHLGDFDGRTTKKVK